MRASTLASVAPWGAPEGHAVLDILLSLALVVMVAAFFATVRRPEASAAPSAASETARRERPRGSIGLTVASIGGLLVALGLLAFGLTVFIALSASVLIAIALHIAVRSWEARRTVRSELALAAALDLMVASLRSGAAILDSLESAAVEASGDTGTMLRDLRDRLRLGEALTPVLDDLVLRYPSEGVRMFAFTLGAHLDSGGSAATSLAEVARAIRDRIDVIRRTSSQSAETQASVVGILGITYGLALLMWKQYPERVEIFTASDLGRAFVGLSILLQALGLAWIWSITRIEV